MLEAASLSKPILCFDKSRVAKEFVGTDCGVVVPYLDINKMAEEIIKTLENSEYPTTLGRNAAKKC